MKQLTVLYYFKFDADGKATILFLWDEKKKVVKLKMEAIGFSFDGVKE